MADITSCILNFKYFITSDEKIVAVIYLSILSGNQWQ